MQDIGMFQHENGIMDAYKKLMLWTQFQKQEIAHPED
jgi:hypothetical protein